MTEAEIETRFNDLNYRISQLQESVAQLNLFMADLLPNISMEERNEMIANWKFVLENSKKLQYVFKKNNS